MLVYRLKLLYDEISQREGKMKRTKMTKCSACGNDIAYDKKVTCPNCGKVNKKPIYKRTWFIVLVVLFSLSLIGSALGDSEPTSNNNPPTNETDGNNEVVDTETVSQKNAVKQAQQYLRLMAFSRTGLIAQLEFEKYPTEDAVYAVDKLDIDWNKQAALKADNYLDLIPYSRKGLIEQLEFEGFTLEQATYGVENIEVDWMEQAALKAKEYLKVMSFSRQRLIEQLEFEGFTREQAVYGVNEAGL
jgi:ribosomal protein L37E